jgi:hypothetical protein
VSAPSRTTPSSFDDLELELPSSKELELDALDRPRSSGPPPPSSLEIDEDAIRPRSLPPVAAAATSPGPPVSPASAVRTGPHSIPPRVAELSGRYATVEAQPAEGPSWPRYALWAIGGLAVFVGLVLGVRWVVDPGVDASQSSTPAVDLPVPVEPRPAAEPTWVSVRVEGLPPGSRLVLDGLPASSTFRVPRGGEHVLEITAPGYEDRRIELTADRNRTLRAGMRPAEGTVRTSP